MFSRGRPLKNLVTEWKKENNSASILVNLETWEEIPLMEEDDYENPQRILYNAVMHKWWFSNIGFDTDDRFVYRFNAVWNENYDKFAKLYATTYFAGYSFEKTSRQHSIVIDESTTESQSGNREVVVEKSGSDIFKKGVTTTSNQETSNTGNKLGRATPNEQLGVSGTSDTTVIDSGQDENEYGSSVITTETPNLGKDTQKGARNDTEETVYHDKFTSNEIKSLYKLNSVAEAFALCFEKLFMGVL